MHCPPCSVVYVVKLVPAKNTPSDKIYLTHLTQFQSKSRPAARKHPLSRALPVSPARLRIQGMMHSVSFSNGSRGNESINQGFIRSSGRMEVGQQTKNLIRSSGCLVGIKLSYLMLRKHIRLHSSAKAASLSEAPQYYSAIHSGDQNAPFR